MNVALSENEQEVEVETDNKLSHIANTDNGLISMILALSEKEKEQAEEAMLAKKVASQAKPRKKSRRTREPMSTVRRTNRYRCPFGSRWAVQSPSWQCSVSQ